MRFLDSIKDRISKWLLDEKFLVTQVDTAAVKGIAWGLNVSTPPPLNVKFAVLIPADMQDKVVLAMGIAISPEHKAELEKLKQTERVKVVHSVLSRALIVCNDCKISVQPTLVDPATIVINLELYKEELESHGKPLFMKSVIKLINTYLAIVSAFNEWFPIIPLHTGKGLVSEPFM